MSVMNRGIESLGHKPSYSKSMEVNPTYVTHPLSPTNFTYHQEYAPVPYQYPLSAQMFPSIEAYYNTVIPTTNKFQEVNYSSFRGID